MPQRSLPHSALLQYWVKSLLTSENIAKVVGRYFFDSHCRHTVRQNSTASQQPTGLHDCSYSLQLSMGDGSKSTCIGTAQSCVHQSTLFFNKQQTTITYRSIVYQNTEDNNINYIAKNFFGATLIFCAESVGVSLTTFT